MGSAQAITFGQLLKRYRIAAGLTQEALAERSGLAVRSLSDLERDVRRLPHPDTIQRVVAALRLSAQDQATLTAAVHRGRTPASTSPTEDRPVSTLTPFVGRADAMNRVERFLAGQEPPVLLFAGEPGIGKSRILHEAAAVARTTGWRVLVGGCTRRSGQASYTPLTDALAQAIARTSLQQQRLDLQGCAWLSRLLPELSARALAPAPSWTLPPEQERRLLFAAVRRYLSNVAGPSGTLLVLDDLQWAGDDALNLLESLARVSTDTADASLLLVGAYRETEAQPDSSLTLLAGDLARDGLAAQYPVRALDHQESLLLADLVITTLRDTERTQSRGATAHAIQGSQEPSELARQLVRRAGGVPFFLESCAIGLQLSGQGDGADGAASSAPGEELPQASWRVTASIRQRVSELPLDAQQLVSALAVVGRSASFALLAAVLDWPKSRLMWAVEAACRARVLEEMQSGTLHLANYQFPHDLMREVVALDLSAARRIVLHHAVGVALETSDAAMRRPEELAFHFAQAEEHARALPYSLLAGDRAESVYAHAEATDHYRAALAAARELGDPAREAEALEKLGVVNGLLGQKDEAVDLLGRALRSYEAIEDQEGELRALAALLEIQGLYGRQMVDDASERAQAILARIEPADRTLLTSQRAAGLAAVYRGLALVYLGSGRYDDLLLAARRAAELARAADDERQLVWALHRLYVAGGLDDDPAALETILAMAERSGQAMIVVFAHNLIAARHADAGEFALGMPHMEQSLAVAEERGDPIHLAWQLRNFAEFLFNAGDWTFVRETSARAESIIGEADPPGATWHAVGISIWPGIMAMVEGREEEGRRLLEHSIARIEQVGRLALLDTPICLLAEADVLAGRAEQAERRLISYLHAPHPTPAEREALGAQVLLAWAEGMLGHKTQAQARLAVVLESAEPLVRVDALRVQGLLATLENRWDVAGTALEEAFVRSHAMPSPYAEAKALWALGRLEVARGNFVAARERFVEALAICDQLDEGLYRKYVGRDITALGA
jgi:transcriptional regulator with XRE-family HTH domain/tetratricopeptide (TPR) repeat protein